MKITIEITDSLLAEVERTAGREGTSVQSLVEEGLRLALERRDRRDGFKLRDASVGGRGLRLELRSVSWDLIRTLTRRGRSG